MFQSAHAILGKRTTLMTDRDLVQFLDLERGVRFTRDFQVGPVDLSEIRIAPDD